MDEEDQDEELSDFEDVLGLTGSHVGGGLVDGASIASWDVYASDDGLRATNVERHRDSIDEEQSNDDVLSHQPGFQRIVDSLQQSKPKFIWEKPGLLQSILGKSNAPADVILGPVRSWKRPVPPLDVYAQEALESGISRTSKSARVFDRGDRPFFFNVLKKSSTLADEEGKRKTLCSAWASIIILNLEAFDLGRNLLQDKRVVSRAHVLESINLCIAGKATSTVLKRLTAMVMYSKYCTSKGLQLFPLSESGLFDYMSFLLSDPKTRPTTGKSFIEAVRFAGAVFGLSGIESVASARVSGAAEQLARAAPPTSQAVPLTVAQVGELERLACEAPEAADRALFGGLLIMLYGCARNSDMARATEVHLDPADKADGGADEEDEPDGYIELSVIGSKGARSVKLRRAILPVVAPMLAVSGRRWWQAWLEARRCLGMEVDGPLDFPLLSRFTPDGQPEAMSLMATETGALLRTALGIQERNDNKVRSHSLKVTCLSWLAKFGVPLEYRRSLGHHLDVSAKSAECYSRDAMAPALRQLCKVVKSIERSTFLPDATRSGRFRKPAAAEIPVATDVVGERQQLQALENGNESDHTESEEVSLGDGSAATDLSSDADNEALPALPDTQVLTRLADPSLRPLAVKVRDDCSMWRHADSGKQHLQVAGQTRLVCGRIITSNYTQSMDEPIEECEKCVTCFTSKEADPTLEVRCSK